MRRFGVEAAEHAADLGQLLHQMGLVLQAPGGVDDQRVDPGRGGLLDPVDRRSRPRRRLPCRRSPARRSARPRSGAARSPRRGRCRRRPAARHNPAPCSKWPSLPMVVVLPEPLTPITRMTCGRGKPQTSSGLATGARIASISSARMVRRPRSSSCSKRRAAMASRIRFDASGPRSEAISASSMSSRVGGVERLLGAQAR